MVFNLKIGFKPMDPDPDINLEVGKSAETDLAPAGIRILYGPAKIGVCVEMKEPMGTKNFANQHAGWTPALFPVPFGNTHGYNDRSA